MNPKSTPLSKASEIIEKDSKEERRKLLQGKREKYLVDYEKSKLKNSTFNKLLMNKRVRIVARPISENPRSSSFNTLAIKNKQEILVARSNNRGISIHSGPQLDQIRTVNLETRGIRDAICTNGNFFVYNSTNRSIFKILGKNEKSQSEIWKIINHKGNAFVGSVMRKSLDDDKTLILSESWNSLIHFNIDTLEKFTIMEGLKEGSLFYDHACLRGNRVILGTAGGIVKLFRYDQATKTSDLISQRKIPMLNFSKRSREQPTNEGWKYAEQIARISVCPKGKVVAFNCWHRTQSGYFNSSVNFVEIQNGGKLVYKMKYVLSNFKIGQEIASNYNQRASDPSSLIRGRTKLTFFQAFAIQGYRGQCVFLSGISFKKPSLLFSFGYNSRLNKIVSKRVEEIDSVGSILQMKMFDRELFTVDAEGKVYNLG